MIPFSLILISSQSPLEIETSLQLKIPEFKTPNSSPASMDRLNRNSRAARKLF
jgi:hypothetical protein